MYDRGFNRAGRQFTPRPEPAVPGPAGVPHEGLTGS